MSTIHIDANEDANQVLHLVRSAVDSEIVKLQLALQLAQKRLAPFEEKYDIASEQFAQTMTAEDLLGGDDEYVRWAGEFQLKERLQVKLRKLQEVEFSDTDVLRSNQVTG